MKNIFLIGMALLMALAPGAFAADATKEKDKDAKKSKRGKLVHTVCFKFKETATKDDIKKVEDAFRALKQKVPQIATFEWGTNVSPEKHDKGFTHAYLLTFKTEKDRDDYAVHPDHKEFGKLIGPFIADVFVVDFWVKK